MCPMLFCLKTIVAFATWSLLLSECLTLAAELDSHRDTNENIQPAKQSTGDLDPFLFRRAVTSGFLTAREAKTAFEFHRLRGAKTAGRLSHKQVTQQLDKLGIRWDEGEALLKRLVAADNLINNGSFESGDGESADQWITAASHPPMRSQVEAKQGNHSISSVLVNDGATPCEGLLRSNIPVEGGKRYRFSFWIKPMNTGPTFVSQYHLQWQNQQGQPIDQTDLIAFAGPEGQWTEVEIPRLVAPPSAKTLRLTFRFVTGADADGHGEIYLDEAGLFPETVEHEQEFLRR